LHPSLLPGTPGGGGVAPDGIVRRV
jgi:hypothetical protein